MANPLGTLALLVSAAAVLSGCTSGAGDAEIFGSNTGGTLKSGEIIQTGSSTVLPLAEVWGEEFGQARGVNVVVSGGGSGAGYSGLCAGTLDLADASSKIKQATIDECKANGVDPVEWKIAYDALSVVVDKDNTFVKDLTVAQLALIFKKEGHATKWNEVDTSFPANDIHLCYPDGDSGTYEYFNEKILNKGEPRTGTGVQQSADDNVLVTCLKNDPNAIGYFGLAYLEENLGSIKAVKVGGVGPSMETVSDKTYTPLSRFIYIYTDGVPRDNILADYLHYVLHEDGGQRLIESVGYIPLDRNTVLMMQGQLDYGE